VRHATLSTWFQGGTSSTQSSIGSILTEVLQLEDDDYDMDFPPYPRGFPRFSVFPPRRGDVLLNFSNDKLAPDGKTDDQRQQHKQRNSNRAQRRAHEEEECQR
jgi:hypothetical protein